MFVVTLPPRKNERVITCGLVLWLQLLLTAVMSSCNSIPQKRPDRWYWLGLDFHRDGLGSDPENCCWWDVGLIMTSCYYSILYNVKCFWSFAFVSPNKTGHAVMPPPHREKPRKQTRPPLNSTRTCTFSSSIWLYTVNFRWDQALYFNFPSWDIYILGLSGKLQTWPKIIKFFPSRGTIYSLLHPVWADLFWAIGCSRSSGAPAPNLGV